jgi:hypothetical protein
MVKIKIENEKQKSVVSDYIRLFETNSFSLNVVDIEINGKVAVPYRSCPYGIIEIDVKHKGKDAFLDFEGNQFEKLSNAVFSYLEREVARKKEEKRKNNKADFVISAFENYGSGPTEKKAEEPKTFSYGVEYKSGEDGVLRKRELSKEELLNILNKNFIPVGNDKDSFFTF